MIVYVETKINVIHKKSDDEIYFAKANQQMHIIDWFLKARRMIDEQKGRRYGYCDQIKYEKELIKC